MDSQCRAYFQKALSTVKEYLPHIQANKSGDYGRITKLLRGHDCFISLIFVFRGSLVDIVKLYKL